MNIDTSALVLSIIGALITGLGVALWWVITEFVSSVKALKLTVSEIKTVISVVEERMLGIRKDVDKADVDLSKKIDVIERQIERLDEEVVTLREDLQVLKVLEKEHHATK